MQDLGPNLLQSARWIERHQGRRVVVKLGGVMLQEPSALRALAAQIAIVRQVGMRPIVVHGAGVQVDRMCAERGVEVIKHGGRRATSSEVREILVEASAALNALLIREIELAGASAEGMEAGVHTRVACRRRPPQEIGGEMVDFGWVGDLTGFDPGVPEAPIPVLPSLAVDENGEICNANADGVAGAAARGSGAEKLIFLTTAPGVMRSMHDDGPISTMTSLEARELIETGAAEGGMKAKLEEALRALEGGVRMVHIVSGREPHTLLRELFTDEGSGTLIASEQA
jgi:acetylglutamate kinase